MPRSEVLEALPRALLFRDWVGLSAIIQYNTSVVTFDDDPLNPVCPCQSMAQRPPAPSSNSGPARPRAQPPSLSNSHSTGRIPSNAARPRTALGQSRTALQVSDSSDDDSDGLIRQDGGSFMAPPPMRGMTPSVARPVVRPLQLPVQIGVQRVVISDDDSGGDGGNISGTRHPLLC